jgi:hypothetical protein
MAVAQVWKSTKFAIERSQGKTPAGAALVVCWEELAEMLVWVARWGDGGLGGDL